MIEKMLITGILSVGLFSTVTAEKPNVLFIAIDDMNDWSTLFDKNNPIKTPNLERLAARGCFFSKAYCAVPGCNPSRTALLTGLLPTSSGVYSNGDPWRKALPDAVTLPKYFENHGYATRGAGKIFHHGATGAEDPDNPSFQEFFKMLPTRKTGPNYNGYTEGSVSKTSGDWGEHREKMIDIDTVEWVEARMEERWNQPLFLAAGIFKPHLPHYAPPAIFAQYPFNETNMPPMPKDDLNDIPPLGLAMAHTQFERYQKPASAPVDSPGSLKKLVQSYQASATFADSMVGRLLDKLDAAGRPDNTIIVLWADHGYHLGDKENCVKFTLWEKANRVPFIIVAPGTAKPGSRCDRPVSLVDIYPTLLELAGLPPKADNEGQSLVPLLKNPGQKWARPAIMTQGRGNHAVRSDRWRYIRYQDGTEELYDHDHDPWEITNLAGDGKYAQVIAEHKIWLPKKEMPIGGAPGGKMEKQKKADQAAPEAWPDSPKRKSAAKQASIPMEPAMRERRSPADGARSEAFGTQATTEGSGGHTLHPTAKVRQRPLPERPNMVFIFVDDMGYGDIGPFGSTVNKTPELDRMAEEGMKLTQYYVSSTACTPSRSALLTGCYADRIGMDGRVNFPAGERGLNPQEITIAELLKTRGYATGCFGKWHLGDQPGFLPLQQGFDEYLGIPYSNDMWIGNANAKYPPLPLIKGDRPVAHISDGASQSLLCKVVTDGAVEFIKRHRNEPFFLYLPHAYIHSPRYARKDLLAKAGGHVTRAQIEEVDWSTGQILKALRDQGLAENTLVMFTSDNGGSGGTSMGLLRGGKGGNKYEGHMRVPTIAWWPGQIRPGSVMKEIAATIDMLPTFAALAGTSPPTDRIIDGHDISSLLLDSGAKSPHEVLYYEYEGIRRGPWKLVRLGNKNNEHGGYSKLELYNLDDDLAESNNLVEKYSGIADELNARLDKHMAAVRANQRPAAFVIKPRPLLESVKGVPALTEYLGFPNLEAAGDAKPPRIGKGGNKSEAPGMQ